jgi:hypothetical protein
MAVHKTNLTTGGSELYSVPSQILYMNTAAGQLEMQLSRELVTAFWSWLRSTRDRIPTAIDGRTVQALVPNNSKRRRAMRLDTPAQREGVRLKLTLASRSVTQKAFCELANIDRKTLARFFDGESVRYQTGLSISRGYFKLMNQKSAAPHRGVGG